MSKPYSTSYYQVGTDLRYEEISHERERELFAAARAGDEAAKEFLIKNHLLLAATQGRKWARGALPEDEVISAANYALVLAFERFDYTRGNRFNSFLRPFVRAQIALLWRSKAVNGINEHAPEFPTKTLTDSVAYAGVDDVRLDPSEEHPSEDEDHREFVLRLLEKSKGILTELESEIIARHFSEDSECLSDIAKTHKLTRERIRQIKEGALSKLKRELDKRMKKSKVSR